MTTRILFGIFALALTACGNDVDGTWNGTATKNDLTATVQITLSQDGDNVTGSGTLNGVVVNTALTVTGTVKDDHVSLIAKSSGRADASYEATLDGDTMNGTWSQPEGSVSLTMTRD